MFPVFLLFLIAGASAVKLECTLYSTRYDPLNCDFSNTTIPKGEAIEYVALDASVKKLSFTNCNMTVMPANLFVNFSKIEELSFSSSSLTQLLPGEERRHNLC